jgi:zinc transport system substrate-binding protein
MAAPFKPVALTMAALIALAGCSASGDAGQSADGSPGARKPLVVTDMYPTTFAVQQVAGDAVEVVQLAPPGVEPHDYELTPKQVQQVADADLVAYLPAMIPAVEKAVEQAAADRSVDVTEGITRLEGHAEDAGADGPDAHGGADPHVWLDPGNVTIMGQNVADALSRIGVTADATDLTEQMTALDEEMTTALAGCTITPMVVSHEAFGYLAKAYGFEQVGISGLSPESEPSPSRMAEIIRLVETEGVTTIYFESLVSPAAAEAIAAETGATTALLDPIEGNTDDQGYPTLMRANKDALQAGQSCS